jgi:hypothetical protein
MPPARSETVCAAHFSLKEGRTRICNCDNTTDVTEPTYAPGAAGHRKVRPGGVKPEPLVETWSAVGLTGTGASAPASGWFTGPRPSPESLPRPALDRYRHEPRTESAAGKRPGMRQAPEFQMPAL